MLTSEVNFPVHTNSSQHLGIHCGYTSERCFRRFSPFAPLCLQVQSSFPFVSAASRMLPGIHQEAWLLCCMRFPSRLSLEGQQKSPCVINMFMGTLLPLLFKGRSADNTLRLSQWYDFQVFSRSASGRCKEGKSQVWEWISKRLYVQTEPWNSIFMSVLSLGSSLKRYTRS